MTSLSTTSKRVKRILEGHNFVRQGHLDDREIADTLRDVAHYLMKGRWYELKKEGVHDVPAQYVATYPDVEVQTVQRFGKTSCYIDLPAIPMELPMDLGVQRIVAQSNDEDESVALIPVPRYFKDIYGSLNTGMLEGLFGYEVERGKAYFTEVDGETIKERGVEKVTVDEAVISPQDVGNDDPFPAPPEMIEQMVQLTLQRYGMSTEIAQNATMKKTPNLAD